MKLKLLVTQGDRILTDYNFDPDTDSITVHLPINIEASTRNYKTGKEKNIACTKGVPIEVKFERTK